MFSKMGGLDLFDQLLKFRRGARLFSQGERADAMFFVQTGSIRITVLSAHGAEASLRILGPNDFVGEECMIGDSLRVSTATSVGSSTVYRVDRVAIMEAVHITPSLCRDFVTSFLTRNLILEQDLCVQI